MAKGRRNPVGVAFSTIQRASASARRCRSSGTLLDRIDIHIDVPAVKFKDLASDTPAESSAEIRERVVRARRVQLERFNAERIYCNAQMSLG